MALEDIVISESFLNHPPNDIKIQKCRDFYKSYNKADRDIVINKRNVLTDGYIAYLILRENEIMYTNVLVKDETENKRGHKVTYIFGKHFDINSGTIICEKEYVWSVPKRLINKIDIGSIVIAKTKYGTASVVVVKIMVLNSPPIHRPINKVVKIID